MASIKFCVKLCIYEAQVDGRITAKMKPDVLEKVTSIKFGLCIQKIYDSSLTHLNKVWFKEMRFLIF